MTQAEKAVRLVREWEHADNHRRDEIETELYQMRLVLVHHNDKVFVRGLQDELVIRTQDAAASRGS